jgi:hypothetical protein
MDNINSLRKTAFLAAFSVLIITIVLASSTYAWFTQNEVVYTERVTGQTSEADVVLLLSQTSGSAFKGATEVEILQVNSFDREKLMPVSTYDLKSFVYKDSNISFANVMDEKLYYHGRIYMKAESGSGHYSKLALYWDDFENIVKAEEGSLLLNAARLGLAFSGGASRIYYLSDSHNAEEYQIRNTYIGGGILPDGNVLHSSGGAITVATDPAISLKASALTVDDAEAIMYMNIGEIYTLDIYFYLEGCDPDCSGAIEMSGAELYLSFYGIPE